MHEGAPRPPVNRFIKEYAGRLGAGSVVGRLPDGRNIRLADPVEHGYTIDDAPAGDADWQMSQTDGMPVPRDREVGE